MRRTVRSQCFETNSSSMHSIVITTDKGDSSTDCYIWDEDKHIVKIWGSDMEFGRSPFAILHTFYDKVRYAVASYSHDDDVIQEIEAIFYKVTGNTLEIKTEKEDRYRRCDTKEEVPWYEMEWIDDPDCKGTEIAVLESDHSVELEWRQVDVIAGYGIDHQSQGLLQGFLKEKEVSLEDFLTSSRYIVFIDGDEYNEQENLFKSNIIDLSKIEERYPPRGSYDSYLYLKRKEGNTI